jgi:tRNA threonylcarbamoyladenosine modification (KEOPS) complex Cgi121 subunit
MGSVFVPGKVDHAVNAGESGSPTAISMGIEFLLRQDVTARLVGKE